MLNLSKVSRTPQSGRGFINRPGSPGRGRPVGKKGIKLMRFCNAGALLCLVFLLGRPPLKGGASPRLPLTSLDTFIHSPASFFSLAARPLPPGSAHSYFLLLFSAYLFAYFLSHFPYCGPIKEGAALSPSILSSFTSPLFIIYPLFSLQRPFILPARRAALARKACKISSEKIKSRVHLSTRHRSNSYSI